MFKYDFEQSVGAWVGWTSRSLERALNTELSRYGITPQQWAVIATLVRSGPISQAALARTLRVEAPTVCRMLDVMERDGWVARENDPDDRRRKRIELAPAAEEVWAAMARSARAVRETALKGFSDEERTQLQDLLARVRANLDPN